MGRYAVIALVLVTLPLATVHAQESEAQRTAAARALFEQGMRAVDARDWAHAADLLRRSLELRPSPVVRFNLALALSEEGHLVEASEHLRALQRDPQADARIQRPAAERLNAILGRIGRLQIDVRGARSGLEVRLDGNAMADALIGVARPADPGPHRVTLHRGAEEVAARQVTVESGELATLELVAPAVVASPEEAARRAPLERSGPTDAAPAGGGVETEWWFWTLIGVLVVGAAVGVTVAVLTVTSQPGYINGDSGTVHPTLLELP